jgi:predicted DNA-binding transcriptional regulator AlpA
MIADDELVTLEEAGRMLSGVSERSVRRLIASSELPQPLKVLSVPTLAKSDVLAYIERLKAKRRGDK